MESRKQTQKSNFSSLETTIQTTPNFTEVLISRLLSPNVQIIHNALQLINSLILTFAISNQGVSSQLFEDFRDAGLLRNVAQLFDNKPLAASCSPQLYDLQELVRAVFHQNSSIPVDPAVPLHRKSLKQVEIMLSGLVGTSPNGSADWQRAGLSEGSDPVSEFNSGLKWSGLQDFSDFLSQDDMLFKKMYLEHLAFAQPNSRFPLAQASLAVSEVLYDTFGIKDHKLSPEFINSTPESFIPPPYIVSQQSQTINNGSVSTGGGGANDSYGNKVSSSMLSPTSSADTPSANGNASASVNSSTNNNTSSSSTTATTLATNTTSNAANGISVESELAKLGKLRPLIFEWSNLLSAGIINFLRLWLASNAQALDFANIKEVVKILFRQAIPNNDFSTVSIDSVVNKLDTLSYSDIRAIQLRNIEEELNHQWGYEIRSLHNQFHQESYDFVKEQRIRLLLRGEWFYIDNPTSNQGNSSSMSRSGGGTAGSNSRSSGANGGSAVNGSSSLISAAAASNANVAAPTSRRYFIALSPSLSTLHYSEYPNKLEEYPAVEALSRSIDLSNISKVVVTSLAPSVTRKNKLRVSLFSRTNYSRISLLFSGNREGSSLTFYTDTPEKAAAWGDGLLMLKNKPYQSTETKKYIDMFAETKLRLQLLQVTPGDLTFASKHHVPATDYENIIPSDDYYYA